MDPGGETGYSLIITEDGQYSLVSGDARGSIPGTSGLTEGTQVFVQGEGGVEVVYIVQPESGDASMGYHLEPMAESGESNGNVMILDTDTSYTEDANTVQDDDDIQEIILAPETSDNLMNTAEEVGNTKEEEEDFNILFFCQYCGKNLQTYSELKIHLKEEHGDDEDDGCEPDPDDVNNVTESLFPSCDKCGSTFVDEADLEEHKLKCTPDPAAQTVVEIKERVVSPIIMDETMVENEGHKCQLCGARFQARKHLDAHFEKRHGDLQDEPDLKEGTSKLYHKCPYCPKVYMSKWHKRSMVKHIKDEHKGQPWDILFDVVECDEETKGRRMNASNGPYNDFHQCLYCNRKFLWQKSLARHYKDMHQDRLDTLEEAELSKLLGNKTKRSINVFGDGGNLSCEKCGKLFLWRKNLESHIDECKGIKQDPTENSENLRPKLGEGLLLKCLFCDLVSKYTCSMRKHMTRFHASEIFGMDVRSLNIPVVDRKTHGHNLISMDKKQTDERLKDLPVVFKCKFCDYVTGGQSNLKRHLMSIKHGISEEALKDMKLSSFKVIQKTKPRYSRQPGRKSGKQNIDMENLDTEPDEFVENIYVDTDGTQVEKTDGTIVEGNFSLNTEDPKSTTDDTSEHSSEKPDKNDRSDENLLTRNNTPTNEESISTQESVSSANNDPGRSTWKKHENVLCPVCDGLFDDFSSFLDHASDHINLKVDFKCPVCEKGFPLFESLKKHYDKDHSYKFQLTRRNSLSLQEVKGKQSKVKAFECPYCDLIVSQSLPLKQHISDNHMSNVIFISIKTEAKIPTNRHDVVSGYRCGFCELKYHTVEDLVHHMQIIHPFADKAALGQGISDSGSVRKSGRKRKTNFRILDVEDAEEEAPSKKTKLDFKSPTYPRPVSARIKKSEVKKNSGESLNKAVMSSDQTDASNKVSTQPDTLGEGVALNETITKNDVQPDTFDTLTNLGLQPVVLLEKSITTDTQNTEEKEKVVKKKVGRKRKEEKVDTNKNVSDIVKGNKISADITTGNKCPYCDFSCKRSSALTFHINFNHAKIKEEPVDEFRESETPSRHKTNNFGISKLSNLDNRDVDGHTYKHIKDIIAQGTKLKDIGARIENVTDKNQNSNTGESLDGTVVKHELDDFEFLDNSDVDQNYKPSGDEDDDEGDGDDEDDFLDEVNFPEDQMTLNDTKTKLNDLPTTANRLNRESLIMKEEPSCQSGRMWKCVICQFICKTNDGVKRHMTRCHPSFRGIGGGAIEIITDSVQGSCNRFKCPYCKYACQHKNSLKRHVKTVHRDKSKHFNVDAAIVVVNKEKAAQKSENAPPNSHFYCPFCGIINKWKKSIVRHIRTTHPDMSPDTEILPVHIDDKKVNKDKQRFNIGYKKFLTCLHCIFSCKALKEMKTHLKRMHDVTQVQGNYQFVYRKSEDQNDLYVNKAQGETGHFACPFCKLEYSWKKSLHLHIKRRHKQFMQTYEALDKAVTIIDETIGPKTTRRPHGIKCRLCKVVCSSRVTLRTHSMKKHGLKKRPYMKNKLFQYSGLWRKIKDDRSYGYPVHACLVCGTQCKGLKALKVHSAIYHRQLKYECTYRDCSERFNWKSVKDKHIQAVHQRPLQQDSGNATQLKCELCNKLCGSSLELKTHISYDHLFWKPKRKPFEYRCKACDQSFDTQNLRDYHFQTDHIELTEICDICGGVFSSKKKLKQHMKVHANHPVDSTIMCDFCGKTMHKKSMQKHLLFKHTETLLCKCNICSNTDPANMSHIKCELCNMSFCQKLTLYAHKRVHHHSEEKLFNCKICAESFPTQKLRNVHLHEKHHAAKPLQNIDDTENNTMDVWRSDEDKDRNTHVIHVGQDKGAQYLPKLNEASLSAVIKELVVMSNEKTSSKPFKCLLCGKAFSRSKYIKLHIRRNHVKDEDKPYRCKVCGSGFVRLTEFRKHSRAHSGFRPFKCKICGKAFKQQANLKDHMHIHKDSKDFQCFICKREFQQRGGMMSHILTHDTIKPFKCMYCEKGFTTRGELSRHMQRYSSELADSKSFLCHICQATFQHFPMLLRHIESHNPEKPFPCEACGGKFASYTALYNHKLKQNHFLLSDIHLADNVVEISEKENIDAQAALEIDLYENSKAGLSNENQAIEQTIYISQDGFGSIVDPNNPKATIIIEPQSEEIVHTTHKLHDNEELLSIAKQLTELSTYTENDSTLETVMNDENEIMKDMLDADTEVLAHVDKQTVKQRQVTETPKTNIPKTIEEILQIQQIQQQDELIIKEQDEFIVNEEVEDFLEEELELKEAEQDEQTIIDEPHIKEPDLAEPNLEVSIASKAPVSAPTNMEELAAFIAQSQSTDQGTDQITAYEMGDGVIYVCMPEHVEDTSYETVLNNAVQSINDKNDQSQEETVKANTAEPAIENDGHPYEETSENNGQVIHVDINKLPENTDNLPRGMIQISVPETANSDYLQQDSLNLYNDHGSSVIELGNDERTFIKQEMLNENFIYEPVRSTMENGIFTFHDVKLRYEVALGHYKCLECGKMLGIKKRLKDHMKRHLPSEYREYVCMYCNNRFVTQNELNRHLTTHTDDRRFKCTVCGKGFRQTGHLAEHLLIHQDIRPFNCSNCELSFRTKHQLVVHNQNKHQKARFNCDECERTFKTRVMLLVHKGSAHSKTYKAGVRGKKPKGGTELGHHQCHKCGKAFPTKQRLDQHLKTHDGTVKTEKRFMCEFCGNSYTTKDYMFEHISIEHSEKTPEICDKCGDAFKTPKQLRDHIRRKHGNTPGNAFSVSRPMKKTHECVVCHKKFSTRHALAYHIGASVECQVMPK